MNDLPCHLKHARSFLYANDTSLLVHGKDPAVIENELNIEIVNIARWFDANKLSMNTAKIKLMHFRHSRNIRGNVDLNISVNGEYSETVSQSELKKWSA